MALIYNDVETATTDHNRTLTFMERRFPESRRKAYYLMSIYERLPPQARKDLKEVGGRRG